MIKKRKNRFKITKKKNRGRSVEEVLKSESKRSFFIFLIACIAIISLLIVMPKTFTGMVSNDNSRDIILNINEESMAISGGEIRIQQNYEHCDYNISECKTSDWISGKVYCLNESIKNSSTCMSINVDDVILDCMNFNITGNRTDGTYGIKLTNRKNITIKNCVVSNFSHGIYLSSSSNNTLINIIFNNNVYRGIYLYSSSNNMLTDITSSNNSYGVYLYSSSNNTLANIISGNNSRDGIYFYSSLNNTLANITLRSNKYNGLSLDSNSNNNTLINSRIFNNSVGINITSSVNNTIYNNYFENNLNAFDDSNEGNYWNTTLDCSGGPNILEYDCIGGNYWSDYRGIDKNNDKIGDTLLPYNSSSNIKIGGDYLPLVYTAVRCNSILTESINLTEDLRNSTNGIICPGNGLVIGVDDIVLDCKGYTIRGNGESGNYGILINGKKNVTIKNCIIKNFDVGINLTDSVNNTIYNNYFENNLNAFDDSNEGNYWNITKTPGINIIGGSYFGGNYWSDYLGIDINEDGIGDTLIPYNSSGNITIGGDYLPLKDTTPPHITILSPANNSWHNALRFNVTINEAGLCWAEFNNTNITMINSSASMKEFYYINTSIAQTSTNKAYNVTFYCNDTMGNQNKSEMRFFGIDTDKPVVNLTSPENNAVFTTADTIVFEYNVTDEIEISSCRLIIMHSNYVFAHQKYNTTRVQKNLINNISKSLDTSDKSWKINCTDEAGNEGGSTIRNITIEAVEGEEEREGAGGGGGGGGGEIGYWITTYAVDDLNFIAGYNLLMKVRERAQVIINSVYHYVGIVGLTSSSATINVSSQPQQATFSIGQEKKFEVTNDTYYDISVKLNGISTISGNLSANLTIKKIHEQITAPTAQAISPPTPTATPTEKGTPMTTTEKKSKFFLVFLIILAIVIVLGIGGFIVWKEFIEKKPEVSEETQTVTPPSPIIQPQRISQPVIPSVSPIPPRQPILQTLQTPQKTPSPVSMPAPSLQQLEKTQPKPTTEPLPKQTEEETIALLKKIAFEKNQTPQTSTLSEKNSKPEEKPNEKKERREA